MSAKQWFAQKDCRIPNDAALIGELTTPRVRFTSAGKLRIESKDEARARGIKSPDRADAFCLTFAAAAAKIASYSSTGGTAWNKPLRRNVGGVV